MINDDGVAIDAEVVGQDNLPVICGFNWVVLHYRKIKSHVILLIYRFALIHIGPPVCKERFHFRVAQLQKWAVPQKLRGRLLGQFRNRFVVQAPQLAVDLDEGLYPIALILNFVCVSDDLRNDFSDEAILERKFPAAKFLRKDFVPKLRGGFIPGSIASNDFHRRVRRPVVFESEQREAEILIALDRISWKEVLPDLNSGDFCIIRDTINDTFRAALIDVVLPRDHLQPRRLNTEHEIFGDVGSISLQEVTKRVVICRDGQARGTRLDHVFFRDQFSNIVSPRFLRTGAVERFVGKYDLLILLFQQDGHVPQSRLGIFHLQAESRRATHRTKLAVEREPRRLALPPFERESECCQKYKDDEAAESGDTYPSPRRIPSFAVSHLHSGIVTSCQTLW